MPQPQNLKKPWASAVFVQFLQSYKTPIAHLFSAVYRGETTPSITIIGAHLVVGGFPPSHLKQMLSLIGSFPIISSGPTGENPKSLRKKHLHSAKLT